MPMVMKKIVILSYLIISSILLFGQARETGDNLSESPKQNFGLGIGIDYGGFGGRFTYLPAQKIGLFAAVGYNLVGIGFNGGVTYKFNPSKRVTPALGAMYGYNGVIKIEDGSESSSTYYGPSFCFGVELKNRRNANNYWNIELVLPIRSSEFGDEIDRLKAIGYNVTEPLPISISIGYHFGF
jgi:hypothetical protein